MTLSLRLAQHLLQMKDQELIAILKAIVFSFLFLITSYTTFESDITIIFIEGKAYLADVDTEGKVVHKYMEVKDFVDSPEQLSAQIDKATEEYKRLLELEKDQIRFIAIGQLTDEIGEIAMTHLTDLTQHYNNSYANQVVITMGKRPGNEAFLNEKGKQLKQTLVNLNVAQEDIEIIYKWDRGPEPTQFIKVRTGLRELPKI